MTPIAHASDGGGSIRIPASCCGVFGLKPTRGRNPLGPDFGDLYGGLAVEHAVTMSVRDSAALLDISSGPDLGDPYFAPGMYGTFLDALERPPGRLRVAVMTDPLVDIGAEVEPVCLAAVGDAAALCESLGHDVTETAPNLDGEQLSTNFDVVWKASIAGAVDGWLARLGRGLVADDLEPLTRVLYGLGSQITASDYIGAATGLQRLSRSVARFQQHYDVLLSPVLTVSPPPLGWLDSFGPDPLVAYERDARMCAFLPMANMTGQPAMSVPTFWSDEGLPVGVHFAGRVGEEATLFRLAAQIEEARPWAQRRPPAITESA
jgi:Asp-tRNA(Asn)/Glu-tRNA(Gln) amidotransferase A subunit family amidase